MLSENEKEAIEQFKSWREYIIKHKEETNQANDLEFYIRTVLTLITRLEKENEELKQYDYRNIKLDEKDVLKSPSMPKEKLDLMNNGIAIYKSFNKLFNDEEDICI